MAATPTIAEQTANLLQQSRQALLDSFSQVFDALPGNGAKDTLARGAGLILENLAQMNTSPEQMIQAIQGFGQILLNPNNPNYEKAKPHYNDIATHLFGLPIDQLHALYSGAEYQSFTLDYQGHGGEARTDHFVIHKGNLLKLEHGQALDDTIRPEQLQPASLDELVGYLKDEHNQGMQVTRTDASAAKAAIDQAAGNIPPAKAGKDLAKPIVEQLSAPLEAIIQKELEKQAKQEEKARSEPPSPNAPEEQKSVDWGQVFNALTTGTNALQTGLQGTLKTIATAENAKGAKGLHAVAAGLTVLTTALSTFVAVSKAFSPEEDKQKSSDTKAEASAKPTEAKVAPAIPTLEIIKGATRDIAADLGKAA